MKYTCKMIFFLLLFHIGISCKDKTSSPDKKDIIERLIPEFTVRQMPVIPISGIPVDEEGFINLLGESIIQGWRGYGKEHLPGNWVIENGTLTLHSSGTKDGGDIIFASAFRNFELQLEWKIPEGGNSGIFYLVREIETKDIEGKSRLEPMYISAPEYQILDNENNADARLGKDNNRQSASLYDMIPAVPQNAKPYGEWNKAGIRIKEGLVTHEQNGEKVVEYQLWSPEWTNILQNSKFSETKWPLAFELLHTCGGYERQGYIGLQDHGYDVWFRNIRIKITD